MERAFDKRLTGAKWRRIRRAVLDRDGWRCQRCGRPGALEVHHIDRDPGDNRLENLQAVCRPCHIDLHRPPVAPAVERWARLVADT